MWLHFLLFGLIFFFAFLQKSVAAKDKNNSLFLIMSFFVFFIFISFRAYTVGNDTAEYYRIFELVHSKTSLTEALSATRYEKGFLLFNYILSRFTDNFTVVLISVTAFYLISSYQLINRYAKSNVISVILMFTMSLFYIAMNLVRQCIAMGIFYIAIPLLIDRKYIKYCILIGIACLFHNASIILFALCIIPNINFKKFETLKKWLLLVCAGFLGVGFLFGYVLSLFPYYRHYLQNSIYSEGGIRIASVALVGVRLVPVVLMGVVHDFRWEKDNISEEEKVFNKLLFLDIAISLASVGFNLLDRFEKFFTLGFIISCVNKICSEKRANRNIILLFTITITFMYITFTTIFRSSWSSIFPYSFKLGG